MLTVEPDVIAKYVDAGKLKLIFRDVLSHGERSQRTAEAAVCAGQQEPAYFWRMHEIFFARQDVTERTAPAALVPLIQGWAGEVEGLDRPSFNGCLAERHPRQAIQTADAAQRRNGITSQPIFEIGGKRLFGFQSLEQISAAIDAVR